MQYFPSNHTVHETFISYGVLPLIAAQLTTELMAQDVYTYKQSLLSL